MVLHWIQLISLTTKYFLFSIIFLINFKHSLGLLFFFSRMIFSQQNSPKTYFFFLYTVRRIIFKLYKTSITYNSVHTAYWVHMEHIQKGLILHQE